MFGSSYVLDFVFNLSITHFQCTLYNTMWVLLLSGFFVSLCWVFFFFFDFCF